MARKENEYEETDLKKKKKRGQSKPTALMEHPLDLALNLSSVRPPGIHRVDASIRKSPEGAGVGIDLPLHSFIPGVILRVIGCSSSVFVTI